MCAAARASLLTGPAPAGIAVIQLVGPGALDILEGMFVSKALSGDGVPDDRLCFGQVKDGEEVLDDAVVWCRREGATYRVEIQCHGGVRICERILHRAARLGADLGSIGQEPPDDDEVMTAAGILGREILEAVRLAATPAVARWILRQQETLPAHLNSVQQQIARGAFDGAAEALGELLARNAAADVLVRGVDVALIGPPNAGKSTLVNALTGRPGSIVSSQAGTTRDWVRHPTAIEGVPVTVTDTAGLGAARDPIDAEAMARGLEQVRQADVVMLVLDRSVALPGDVAGHLAGISGAIAMVVANKSDLPAAWASSEIAAGTERLENALVVEVSALTRVGISDLGSHILHVVGLGGWQERWPALWTARQRDLCFRAHRGLSARPDEARELLSDVVN